MVSDPGKAGEVVDAAAERRVARRELVRLDSPVVGWLTADIRPDGSLEPGAGGVHGEAYTDTLNTARACERPHVGTPPVLGGSGLHPVVASVHAVPFPLCSCGLPCDYEPHGRLFDHYRDRLGYRMRTVALVEVWGRLMVQNAGVRG